MTAPKEPAVIIDFNDPRHDVLMKEVPERSWGPVPWWRKFLWALGRRWAYFRDTRRLQKELTRAYARIAELESRLGLRHSSNEVDE